MEAVIASYINDAEPVSSERLSEKFNCSSATIRNIFSQLEDDGYLKHPHTSSGRIPTDKGYRYYVDFLSRQMKLLEEEKKSILDEYQKNIEKIEDLFERTSHVISFATKNAGIVSCFDYDDKLFFDGTSYVLEQPEFEDISRIKSLVKVLEEKHKLIQIMNSDIEKKNKVYIGNELGYPEIEECSLIVSSYKAHNMPKGYLAVLGPKRMEYSKLISTLDYISELLSGYMEQF